MFLDNLNIDPIAFTIPIGENGFPIYWYGIIITAGIIIGSIWGAREIGKRGEDPDELYNGLILVVLAGYFFARIGYVVLDIMGGAQYSGIGEWLNIRQGGVNILTGFIGAVVVGWLFLTFRNLKLWHFADVTGPILLLAQGIGRWANFINQELYGQPTGSNWGILIDPRNRLSQYADLSLYPADTRFHPTFLYESVWLILGFIVLTMLNRANRDKWPAGVLFGIFLIWWGLGRVVIEFFRPDQTIFIEPITWSMVLAALIALAGVFVILNRTGRINVGTAPGQRKRKQLRPKPDRSQRN